MHQSSHPLARRIALTLVAAVVLSPGALLAQVPWINMPGEAQRHYAAPGDEVMPISTPVAIDGWVAHQIGANISGIPGAKVIATEALDAVNDDERGYVSRFNNAGRIVWELPTAVLAPTTQVVANEPQPYGLGLSLHYRHHAAADQRVNGWAPLAALGKLGQPWSVAVVLKNGVPVVAQKETNGSLFDVGAIAVGHQPTLRVDDGKWHHIVLGFAQPANPNGCGGKAGAACNGPGFVRLYVDGSLASEYLVEIGSDLRQVTIGSLDVAAGSYAGQPNWQASPPRLLARGSIDDLTVYRRALTEREISQLQRRSQAGLVGVAPEAHPSLLGLSAISVPAVQGTNRTSPIPGFVATGAPLFMPTHAASGFAAPMPEWDMLTSSGYTLAATMQPNGQKWLLSRFFGTNAWIGFYRVGNNLRAACGSNPFVANAENGALATVDFGAFPANEWARLGIIHDVATSKTTVIANQWARSLSCGKLPTAGVNSYARHPNAAATEAAANVARAAIWRRAMTLDELDASMWPGPLVWTNPASASGSQASSRTSGLLAGTWLGGTPPVGGVIDKNVAGASQGITYELQNTRLDPTLENGADRPFTIAVRVKVDKVGGAGDLLLARRYVVGSNAVDAELRLRCDNGWNGCRLYILSPAATVGGVSGQWRVDQDLVWGTVNSIVVSWPVNGLAATVDPNKPQLVTQPRVAINGVLQNKTEDGGLNHVVDIVPVWKMFGDHKRPAATAGQQWRWQVGGTLDNSDRMTLSDVRIYAHAVQAAHDLYGTCATSACANYGQLCTDTGGQGGPVCYDCDGAHERLTGTGRVEVQCRKKVGFYQECISDGGCISGRCDTATRRCMAVDASKKDCDDFCFERGRACVANGAGAGGTAWRCADCTSGFKRLPGYDKLAATHPGLECVWNPTKGTGQLCGNDAECHSARCDFSRSAPVPYRVHAQFYNWSYTQDNTVWTVPDFHGIAIEKNRPKSPKICMGANGDHCSKHRYTKAQISNVQTPDCKTVDAFDCNEQCDSSFRELRWTVLSPEACGDVLRYTTSKWPTTETPAAAYIVGWQFQQAIQASAFRENFDLFDLKKVVLRDTAPYNNNVDRARLINAGVGRILLEYATGSAAEKATLRAKYGDFKNLANCFGQPGYTGAHNRVACEPKLQPIDAVCPPPGEPAHERHDFCATGYCARDSNTCQNGDNPLLEPRPNAGNQDRQGKDDTKFGLVRLIDTTIEAQQTDLAKNPQPDYYRYVADLTNAYCLRMFGKYVPSFPLLMSIFHLDRTKDEACASYQFKAYIANKALTHGKPKALFGSCTGMQIKDNEVCEQAACTPGPLITGNLSELADTIAGGFFMTVGGAAPGCLPLVGTPVGELIDKMTLLKTKVVGVVPLAFQLGPTLDICIDPLVSIGDEGVPKVTVRPSIAVGIDARGGIGLAEGEGKDKAIKFWAGVQLLLTVVKLGFPIGWGVEVKDVLVGASKLPAMWKLQVSQRIGIDLELFSGSFGLFVELALGPFSIGYSIKLFEWVGLQFEWELSNVPLWSTILDHQKPKINFGSSLPDHNHSGWFSSQTCDGLCK